MLAVGDHESPEGAFWVTESLYLVVRVTRPPPRKGLLCAELRVHPHRLQLGEHLREEAWLSVDPQHRAAGIRYEVRTVVLSNFLYLDGCCEGSQQILPLLQNTVRPARRSNVLSCQTQGTKELLNHIKCFVSLVCVNNIQMILSNLSNFFNGFSSFWKVLIIQIVKSD